MRYIAPLLCLLFALTVHAAPNPWFDAQGRPSERAQQALQLLAAADLEGLQPAHYGTASLQRAQAALLQTGGADPATQTRHAADLEAALKRYLRDLHQGRVDPQHLHPGLKLPPHPDFDTATRLQQALDAPDLRQSLAGAAPALPLYGQLRAALAHYRSLGAPPAWDHALPRPKGGKLEPGQPYTGLDRLAQRLRVLGDLELPYEADPASGYGEPLLSALRSFQRRHGLLDDGVLGRSTLAALAVTPAERSQQIVLMMERLRWMPPPQAQRLIVINIPEFRLRAYEADASGRMSVRSEMKVIVGKAMNTRTPLLQQALRSIEFSPFWNVPPSIARQELIPRLRKDPGYWDAEGFEFVRSGGTADATLSEAGLAAVLAGQARLRQRPGPRNALGSIKFVFPNSEHIYLHHTPAVSLFERERRDFSHGCIRLEQPLALARFVLQDQPEWTEERLRAAMDKGESRHLLLSTPVPVLIAYGTTLVKQGLLHFYADVYGHDRQLARALRLLPAPPGQGAKP